MVRLVLLRFLESYFRHRWLNLLPVVIMLGVAGASFATATPVYIARGGLYVKKESFLASLTSIRENGFSWVTPAQATVDEIKELQQTDAFVRAVVALTDLEAELSQSTSTGVVRIIGEVRTSVWVQPLGSNLIQVGVVHEQPETARQLAAALIETYLQWKINTAREESVAAQAFFAQLIDKYQTDLDLARQEMQSYLETYPEPIRGDRPPGQVIQIERLQAVTDLAATRLRNALDKDEDARLAMSQAESDARDTYLIIDAPRAPDKPETSSKDALIGGMIFLAAGVALCLFAVVGGVIVDRSFRFPIDVRHATDLPVLAVVPDIKTKRRRRKSANH